MAPELLAQKGYDFRVDFYSLGVVFYEMVTGSPPFSRSKKDRAQVEYDILNTVPPIPTHLSKEAQDLLSRLLIKNPQKRIGAEKGIKEIKSHPWLADIDFKLTYQRKFPPPCMPTAQLSWLRSKNAQLAIGTADEPSYQARLRRFSFRCEEEMEKIEGVGPHRQMSQIFNLPKSNLQRFSSAHESLKNPRKEVRMHTEEYLPSRKFGDLGKCKSGENLVSNLSEASLSTTIAKPHKPTSKLAEFAAMCSTKDAEDDDVGVEESATKLGEAKTHYNFKNLVKFSINKDPFRR